MKPLEVVEQIDAQRSEILRVAIDDAARTFVAAGSLVEARRGELAALQAPLPVTPRAAVPERLREQAAFEEAKREAIEPAAAAFLRACAERNAAEGRWRALQADLAALEGRRGVVRQHLDDERLLERRQVESRKDDAVDG